MSYSKAIPTTVRDAVHSLNFYEAKISDISGGGGKACRFIKFSLNEGFVTEIEVLAWIRRRVIEFGVECAEKDCAQNREPADHCRSPQALACAILKGEVDAVTIGKIRFDPPDKPWDFMRIEGENMPTDILKQIKAVDTWQENLKS